MSGQQDKRVRGVENPDTRSRPASIKDIARIANVSHSTVSRALANSPVVNPQTAEMIRRIARESGYKPSAVARGLVTRKTRTVGVVVTTIADPFVGEVVSGVEEAANAHGYSVFLAESNADPEREKNVVRSFAERRVDGIVVTSSRVGTLYVPVLSEMMVPIVLINNQHTGEFVHSVMIANMEASRKATAHLIALGHRRIAYIGDEFGEQSNAERLAGYRLAMRRAGIAVRPDMVVYGDGKPQGGMTAMKHLLASRIPPTAIFCYNDMTALGALRCIYSSGLTVPNDLSLVGFDDLFVASYTQPPLTTVRQPMRRMGKLAMDNLMKLMSGDGAVDTVYVPADLMVRDSTAAPRRKTK